ncbi:hypothetical protein BUN12_3662 [Bacillus amyloliquefaciens]|uniref:hypothetical protein n=1 Tax=Bacillus amyloliquefaciens TaxID=1390 RepID=UPI0007F03E7B|nr:hypothetical protein [Bacillus amyloliquefaciens]ARW37658.1 hypothetical protein S101267_00542 [Bacillus amyloliquefaciens]AZV91906.1 hypothetical protein BUN12_3662 [Bacillus amyloliquefaciens]MDR4378609.1 hypothetical protein [Bacillus amyloliquefaciens]MEC1841566.1 hypothetical protein [Bacillus amyloliquefaciens]MEC1849680.1 hypothetical protein [Bacillus amyloliquefaciens]
MFKGKMYDINGNEVTNNDLQNKGAWCTHGEKKEFVFVRSYGQQLGLTINPEKSTNIYAPDLSDLIGAGVSDLKNSKYSLFHSKKVQI